LHQLPDQAGGQFFFAKAFDKFAPLGPVLVSPEVFGDVNEGGKKITVRVNGKVRQEQEFQGDLIWNPAQILSRMSQGELENFGYLEDVRYEKTREANNAQELPFPREPLS
jgi:2-keto-4-pentenoate hydratase/2-oxohepta-3-ene-1,7-dioic acid hydratase in catechol pathway